MRSDPAGVYARWILRPVIAIAMRSSSSRGTAGSRRARWRESRPTGGGQRAAERAGRPDRPRGLLLDRQRPAAAGRAGERAVAVADFAERTIRRFPLTFYAGGIWSAHVAGDGSGFCSEAEARGVCRVAARLLHARFSSLCQPAGGRVDELAATLLVKPRLLPRLDYSSGGSRRIVARWWSFPRC